MRFDFPRTRLIACALTAAVLGPAATAHAGPPGSWTKVTGIEVAASNTDGIGVFRTNDGVLHVAYTVAPGANAPESLMHRAISKDAKSVAGPDTAATLSTMNNSAALVEGPGGGLRAFFAGVTEENGSGFMRTVTSDAAGKVWSATAPASNTSEDKPRQAYVGSGISAVLATDGTPVSIWGDSSPGGGAMHVGLDPTVPDVNLGDTDCCQTDPALARDAATGELYAGWYHIAPDRTDVLTLGGGLVSAPNGGATQTQDRVALTGRLGGKPGVYLAYTTGTNQFSGRPALWKVGDPTAKVIAGQKGGQNIGIAPAPEGRLWLFWIRNGRVLATRTNKDATQFGANVSIKPPKGSNAMFRLVGDGSLGALDLLGLFEGSSSLGYWHQRIQPGLTLTVTPSTVKAGKKATFRTTDAGESVKGATVTVKLGATTLTGTTNGSGRVKLTIPGGTKAKTYTAKASKTGYAGASKAFRVKKP
jgi:hypothetical protein